MWAHETFESMTYREVLRKEKNRGQRKQLLYENGLFSSRGRLGFYISKRGIVLGGGPIVLHAFHTINGPRATLYYKVLYSILQSTTPVRLLFYKVLLQYDSANIALVRTTNSVLRRSKKYCSILQSTTPVHTTKITTPVYSSTTLY